MLDIHNLWLKVVEGIQFTPGLMMNLVLQPVTKDMIHQFLKRHPNTLGMRMSDEPFEHRPRYFVFRQGCIDCDATPDPANRKLENSKRLRWLQGITGSLNAGSFRKHDSVRLGVM